MSDIKLEKLRKEHIVTIRNVEYQLRKVTEEEIFEHRLSGKPGIVYKKDNELYYSELPKDNLTLTREKQWLQHSCSSEYDCCSRLSAAPDPEGCSMVSDCSFAYYKREKGASKHLDYYCKISMRIEKYSYITEALEMFGMKEESLKILNCTQCSRGYVSATKMDPDEQNHLLLSLAQNLYPEIDSIKKLKEKLDVIKLDDI